MTDATQEPDRGDSHGVQPRGMTSTRSEQPGDASESNNAPSDHAAPQNITSSPAKNDVHSAAPDTGGDSSKGTPKKRRKVNHACIYCRRSHMTCDLERPCTRCVKRSIGHLCHDEPREPVKRHKNETGATHGEHDPSNPAYEDGQAPAEPVTGPSQDAGLNLAAPSMPQSQLANSASTAQRPPAGGGQTSSLFDFGDVGTGMNRNMRPFHPSFMFNTSEAHSEYSLLDDFLSSSLMDDGNFYSADEFHGLYTDPSFINTMGTLTNATHPLYFSNQTNNGGMDGNSLGNSNGNGINQQIFSMMRSPQMGEPSTGPSSQPPTSGVAATTTSSSVQGDSNARDKFYITAADPAGNDTAEKRMERLLQAKWDAGLLRPFNYVRGYGRLLAYMDKYLQPASRQRILRQLDRFRPRFRERTQGLQDWELLGVEVWFERGLMECDRVFASMAIPACCWRRTGEIFRGNREIAEMVGLPIEKLRDGSLAIYHIFAESSLVSYWDKFGAIAFDNSQKAILTHCTLKKQDGPKKGEEIQCCFSFTVKRDPHNIPTMIIGNFLPIIEKRKISRPLVEPKA